MKLSKNLKRSPKRYAAAADEKYMRLALVLAKKGEGLTSPNPAVGAVIVKNGRIVGRGYHKKCGLPHAEVNALNEAGDKAKGATLYVTLEPCNHFGRTPPCADAIIRAEIKRVVAAMKDPNPVNNGRGIRKLEKNGIETLCGVLEGEARALNKPFIKFITTGMPYLTVKMAESLDGKIATKTGDSKWISDEDSRRYVRSLRSKSDAVMVGINTFIKDNPTLLGGGANGKQPVRIIVGGRGRVDLKNLLKKLGKMGIINILAEGGGELVGSLVEKRLVDRFLFFVAPKIIGGRDAITPVEGDGIRRIDEALILGDMKVRKFKRDILIEAEVGQCLPG